MTSKILPKHVLCWGRPEFMNHQRT